MKKRHFSVGILKCLKLAYIYAFKYTAIVDNEFLYKFNNNCDWLDVPVINNTINTKITKSDDSSKLYDVELSFNVSFSELSNKQALDRFLNVGLIAKYISAGSQTKITGSKETPLFFSFVPSSSFDGYECKLTGKTFYPESFFSG